MTRPRVYCVVYGCLNTSTQKPGLSFFKLPAEVERRSKWLNLIGREDLMNKTAKNYTVCEEHFYTQDVLPGNVRKTLKSNALPALLLPDLQKNNEGEVGLRASIKDEIIDIPMDISPEIISRPIFAQQELTSTSTLLTSIKQEKIYEEETECNIVHLHKLCDKFLTKEMAELVKTQRYLTNNSKSDDYKQFCLNFYLINPNAYRLLKNALCLPCPTTNFIPITTDINGRFMLLLKNKVVRMTEIEKNCSVIINTMSLNYNLYYNIKEDYIMGFQDINGVRSPQRAKVAYFMTVRGIFDGWKQPVGYALQSQCTDYTEIYKWIDELLEKLFAIGLNVRAFISITSSGLFNPAKYKSISIDKPYFFVGTKKIYYIFDAPHLFNLLRNNFMENDFHFEECVANFKYILQFYVKDKTKSFKMAEKLTNNHIHPNNIEKTKVIYAAQLLSNSVATGISTYIDFNSLNESAQHTAEFLKFMNDLFDSLNSSNLKDTGHKSAFQGLGPQIEFFKEMLVFFNKMNVINSKTGLNVTPNAKFIEGFQITITSILQLFSDLNSEGCKYLLTRRLNMDVLEIFYDQVRKSCSITAEPTAHQFVLSFRKWFYSNIINLPNRKNRIDDIGEILNELQLAIVEQDKIPGRIQEHNEQSVQIASSDYNQLSLCDKPHIFDICVFLLTKCFEIHGNCEFFKSYVKPNQRQDEYFGRDERYHRYRKYSSEHSKSLLIVPYDNFVKYVEKIEKVFVQCLESQYLKCGIMALIVKEIENVDFSGPCPCFPKTYLIKLYARVRMYLAMKMHKVLPRNQKGFSVKRLYN